MTILWLTKLVLSLSQLNCSYLQDLDLSVCLRFICVFEIYLFVFILSIASHKFVLL